MIANEHAHHEWCDIPACLLDADQDGDYASHYGRPTGLIIDRDDCAWRNRPDGHPEIVVRPIRFTGAQSAGVEIDTTHIYGSTSGLTGVSWLTSAEARELAALLIRTAETAEATR